MSVAERFGQNLIRARKQAGLSQEGLALLASLHRTEIGHLERGQRLARIDTLVKLMGALETNADGLLAGIVWEPGEMRAGRFGAPVEAHRFELDSPTWRAANICLGTIR